MQDTETGRWFQSRRPEVVRYIQSSQWDPAAELYLRLNGANAPAATEVKNVARLFKSEWLRVYPLRRGVGFSMTEVADEVLSTIHGRLTAGPGERFPG